MFKGLNKKVISSFLVMTLVGSTILGAFASANERQNDETSNVNSVPILSQKGKLSAPLFSDEDIENYLATNQKKLGLVSTSDQLLLQSKTSDDLGGSHYLYQLKHNDIPVYGEYMRVHLDKSKRINEIRNEISTTKLPSLPQSTTPKLTKAEAIEKLKVEIEGELGQTISEDHSIAGVSLTPENKASLIIYPFEGRAYLAYEVELNYITPAPGRWVAFVDALNGRVIDKYNSLHHAKSPAEVVGKGKGRDDKGTEIDIDRTLNITIDDLGTETVTDNVYILEDRSKLMYNEDTSKGVIRTYNYVGPQLDDTSLIEVKAPFIQNVDHNAVNAHFYTGIVYDYFLNKHNRNSIDNKGMSMTSVVNFFLVEGEPFSNAFWTGEAMYYGNGVCYSCSLDVIGHEIAHGVTDRSSDLEYRHQSGALNESFSDIFGNLIEMELEGNEEWKLGEDSGEVIRDMKDPGSVLIIPSMPELGGSPATMNDYWYLPRSPFEGDNGGVHINSGIQNKAAYLIATKIDSLGIDGKDILGQLSYDVVVNRLTPVSDFEDSRDAFVSAAEAYVDNNTGNVGIIQAVKDAWAEVGLPYGYNYNIESVEVPETSDVHFDKNSRSIFISVPVGTDLSQFKPEIEVSDGATIVEGVGDQDFSDNLGEYWIKSNDELVDTKIKWTVHVSNSLDSLSYESVPFVETAANNGEIQGEITIKYITFTDDDFLVLPDFGGDFIANGQLVVSPIPKGLTAKATYVGPKEIKLTFTGVAEHHTDRDDIENLALKFQFHAFKSYSEYQIIDYAKDGFTIEFEQFLDIVSTTDTTATLKWPTAKNATAISLLQSIDNGKTWANAVTTAQLQPNSTEATVTGLTKSSDYQFKLAITGGEDAGDSDIVSRNSVLHVAKSISNQTVTDNASDLSLSFADVFINPIPEDSLTYTVTSSTYGVASATINNQSLTIDPISAGTSIITVKADNGKGNIASTSFTVTVTSTRSYSGGGGYVVPTGPVTSTNGKVTIPAGQAGEVGLGTDVNVSIPVGASDKELKITIEKVLDQTPFVTDKTTLASPIYEILKNITENFSKKVTLKLTFDPTKVGANQKPVIFYYDEVKKVWVEVAGGTVSGNQITVEVDHFTKFAVFAIDKTIEPTVSFSDIAGHWAEANIKQAVAAGFVNGYSNGTFKPNDSVTREQFAVMLMMVLKSEQKGEALTFTDSAKIEAWAKDSVAQAVKLGIITGYADGTFRPDATITRSEMASMIAKALELKVVSGAKTDFADDASIPAWAKAAISAVKVAGIMQGKDGNLFKPSAQATRAEAVTVLLNVLEENSK
ncbi:S-layer homology domain-containing protein [Paenibacillus sp. GSMTC-2017]|uniref:S-layer homology domain-containing protein n=1 Tax=Paenibacillus sp. GSMTC-2017 TaxID=2794350 RepID=UPI0018D6EC56|nr:S-layer homology domain-containing protein [Paenibacillus sp. GSMTC-2017]MBH5318305.1 S-layer homology domain-containing protein [Paenibacillus sp. GSMTC-2017]